MGSDKYGMVTEPFGPFYQWYRTSTSVGQLLDVAKNAIGADVSAPGRLVTINASDVSTLTLESALQT